jgi:histidinol dehydrogenase
MPTLKVRRIDYSAPDAARKLAALRDQFNNQGNVVTGKQKKLTEAVFGQALTPIRVVERICEDVRTKGLSAVLEYTEKFDKQKLTAKTVRVPAEELAAAYEKADPEFIGTISRIRDNVMQFQMGILNKDALLPAPEQYELHMRYRPMRRVGIHVPGGAAAYPSTLLMTVCPAQAAEVKEIAVFMPPTPNGAYNPDLLAVCHALGVKEVYRVGGAQGVAALAYGCEHIPPVDMIVGPGNTFVTLAKKYVFGRVAIDCLAGPSELVVVADETAQADLLAIDMIAQAEHTPGVSVLVTWHEPLIEEVDKSLVKLMKDFSRADETRSCLEDYGAFVLCKDVDEAVACVNDLAVEHLHVQTRKPNPEHFADRIDNAGAIFLGQYSPVALGDYVAGPSHVLPTGGTARFASGLSANDFRRRTSIINFSRIGLRDIADDVMFMANKEGLVGHAASVEMRLKDVAPAARPTKKPANGKAKK